MDIYLAAKWEDRQAIDKIAGRLAARGHKIVSTWHDPESHRKEGIDLPYDVQMLNKDWMRAEAEKDLEQIYQCNMVICDETIPSQTGGREVEIGFAMGLYKPILLIGPRRNPFHWLVDGQYDTWEDLFNALPSRSLI